MSMKIITGCRILSGSLMDVVTEISCHIGEKQFFLNPEDNGNINEAEFYIKTTDNESLKVLVGDITAYIKKNYPEARVGTGEGGKSVRTVV